MHRRRDEAPRWCLALLLRSVPPGLSQDALIGDLTAESDVIAGRRGHVRAQLWLLRESLAISVRYAWARLTRRLTSTPGSPRPVQSPDRSSAMSSLTQDIAYGIRSLRATPGTTGTLLFILVLGIGALVATFSLVEAALLRPLPYPDPDRLVWAATTFDGRSNPVGSAQDWADYRERNHTFSDLGALTPFELTVTTVTGQEPARTIQGYVTWNLFRTLGVEPTLGRWFAEADAEPGSTVAMVSHEFWQTQLGQRAEAVGETLLIDGTSHTVIGVMPPGFHFLLDAGVWRPMQLGGPFAGARRFHNWLMIGRLADDVGMLQAQADVDTISGDLQREYPESNEGKALALTPLADAVGGFVGPQLLLMLATAALVLAVAGSNVASLLLARGSTRQSELAIRAALGASRARIVRQLVIESLVLGAVAGVGGMIVASWLRGLMLRVVPLSVLGIERIEMSPLTLGFGIIATLFVSLAFGTVPALRVAPDRPSQALRGERTTSARDGLLRSGLVVAQVSVAVVLLVGSALLVRSFAELNGQDPGFVSQRLLSAEVNLNGTAHESGEERYAFFEAVATRLAALPSIESVTLANQLPIRNPGNNIGIWNADAPPDSSGQRPLGYQRIVRPGYFDAMQIPLIAGRALDAGPGAADPLELILSESLATVLFPDGNAVGGRVGIDWGDDTIAHVVGVAGDVRVSELAETSAPTFYASYVQRPLRTANLAIRTRGETVAVVPDLRAVLREVDPTVPLGDIQSMDELIADSIGQPRLMSMAMTMFSGTALVLSLVGLYGILAQAVARRRREFGLRLALGAERRDIFAIVVRSGMIRVGVGLAAGIPLAVIGSRMLERFLFNVAPLDPVAFSTVAILLVAVALLACVIPARRALAVDPAISLRAD